MKIRLPLIKPRRLRVGDTIGVIAPSSPFREDELKSGISVLKDLGFNVHKAASIYEQKGYLAGDDAVRARQLNEMFADDAVRAVMCARGGFGALKLLPMVDYAAIRAAAKPFIGFSDVTALHVSILMRAGLVTFHGPTVCSLGKSNQASRIGLRNTLTGKTGRVAPIEFARVIRPGKAEGPVVGGNLATMCHLVGTAFFPDLRGRLLLLEETNEAPYRIDRMLTHMKLAGCFAGLGGVLLGDFTNCGVCADIYRLADETFADMGIPVLAGLPVGHGSANQTLALGINVSIDTAGATLAFQEPAMLREGRP